MAGPFDIFRRNQRALLVAVAILAMLAFFVLPPILQQMDPSGATSNATVVRWSGGQLDEAQIAQAVTTRQLVNRFLALAAVEAGRDTSRLQLFMPETEEGVVQAHLLRREASEQGIVISDEAINEFLKNWTNNLVRAPQFDAILARLSAGPMAIGEARLFEALRDELEARTMLVMSQTGFASDTPSWRWDDFLRLEQSAIVEVVAVPSSSLAAEVSSPSESILRAFFEKHRESLPDPESPEPGFRVPHRIEAEYLVALQKPFMEAAAKEVTEEQIQSYYDENKERLFRSKTKTADPAESAAESSSPGEPADPLKEKPATDSGDAKPAAATDGSKTEPSTPSEASDSPGEKAEGAGAAREKRSPFRFVADSDASTQPTTEGPADSESTDTAPTVPAGGGASENANEGAQKAGDASTPEPSYEPLETVRDRIRDDLARGKVAARIEAIFSAVQADVARYSEDLALWRARGEGEETMPRRPDIDAIAKAQGLEAGRTGVVDPIQASDLSGIGESFAFVSDPGSRFGMRQQSWLESMFANENTLRPVVTDGAEGNRYLSWKVTDEPEHTPSFDAARETVEKVWRNVEARKLALEKARALVNVAGGGQERSSEPLEASLAGKEGVEMLQAGPFTWLDQGMVAFGGRPQVSKVPGLESPGDEFMQTVFGLDAGGLGVAFNEPQTVCYCIRLVSLTPDEDGLRTRFLESTRDQGRLSAVTMRDFTTSYRDWIRSLDRKYAVNWKRPPREGR